MMTEKLYELDGLCTEFSARVVECRPAGQEWELLLDRTAFFPGGGGQPADQGTLNGLTVIALTEEGEGIWHRLGEPLAPGAEVAGAVDACRRWDLTQQHSGEHLVSGVIHTLFGYENVGFHMGADLVTVDWNGPLTMEQLRQVERQVNQLIWRNLKTEICFPTSEELEHLEYRSKKELTGRVRIVRFPGADTCACCGTHVRRTGEIGLVKLLSVQKFRSGVRCTMLAGARAMDYCSAILEQNRAISVLLSAKPEQTAPAVERLYQENEDRKSRLVELERAENARLAERYAGAGDVLLFLPGLDANGVCNAAVAVMETCGGRCAVFSGEKYAIGRQGGDLRALVKALNQALNGRGGGKPFFVQGTVKAVREEIEAFFAQWEERTCGHKE